MAGKRHPQEEKAAMVDHIVTELEKGGVPLNVILRAMNPPLSRLTLYDWRKKDALIGQRLDEAFETGGDRMAMQWLATAEGKKAAEGGRSTGNVKRDRLVTNALEKLLRVWDTRYQPKTVLANDPVNPVTNAKPSGLTDDQLLTIAAQGVRAKPDGNG
jgi:hypothetical protein